jgi:hypothetical protein
MATEPRVCAHQGCICHVDAGQSYCSSHCERAAAEQPAGEATLPPCGCGHAECQATGGEHFAIR